MMTGVAVTRYPTAIAYGVLPVMLALIYGEWLAGIFFGILNAMQAFVSDPIAGNVADQIGAKKTTIIGFAVIALAAGLWLVWPLNNIYILTVFAVLVFGSFGFLVKFICKKVYHGLY